MRVSEDLYFDAITKSLVEAYLRAPKQGLLLTGVKGSGTGTLARQLAEKQCTHQTDIVIVEPDEKGTISIERIRSLYVETRGARKTDQVIVIDNAETMSHDAQNSFLKLLEEPGSHVRFILTSHSPETLLPTITSRVEIIAIRPISLKDSSEMLSNAGLNEAAKIQQLLFLAGGLPAELSRLAADQDYFTEQASLVRQARDFLSGNKYQRLVQISKLTDRTAATEFVRVLAELVAFSGKKNRSILESSMVQAIEKTADNLAKNGHVRTQLMALALEI